jgi:hypothetical protein
MQKWGFRNAPRTIRSPPVFDHRVYARYFMTVAKGLAARKVAAEVRIRLAIKGSDHM